MSIETKIYNSFMYPLEKAGLDELRKNLIPQASGTVLEIGSGTGVNLKYYQFENIDQLYVSDITLKKGLKEHKLLNKNNVILLEDNVQSLSLGDQSVDTIVFTLVFCSVELPLKGLAEIKRVLKDDGKIIFIEHVLPHKDKYRRVVEGANKVWVKISSGCNLNRKTVDTIREAGFSVVENTRGNIGIFASGTGMKIVEKNE